MLFFGLRVIFGPARGDRVAGHNLLLRGDVRQPGGHHSLGRRVCGHGDLLSFQPDEHWSRFGREGVSLQ